MARKAPLNRGLDSAPVSVGSPAPLASSQDSAAHASDRDTDFRAFFRAHCAHVGRIALSILSRPDELDDLVQDVFIIAHKNLHRLRAPEAARSWLGTITVREARRRLRRRKLRAMVGLSRDAAEDAREMTIAGTQTSPWREPRVLASELERELDRLPIAERVAWTLRVEGHALPEVATLCDCSLATVKRRVDRARRKLALAFADDIGGVS